MFYNVKKILPLCPTKRQMTAMEGYINQQSDRKRERLLRRFNRFKERVQYYWTIHPWLMVLACVMVSCKSVTPVITTPRNDSVAIRYQYQHDSIYCDRAHYVFIQGDTVFIHDTVTQKFFTKINKTDTIYQNKEVVIDHPPEKYIPRFYKWCTGILILICIIFVCYLVIRVVEAVYLRK